MSLSLPSPLFSDLLLSFYYSHSTFFSTSNLPPFPSPHSFLRQILIALADAFSMTPYETNSRYSAIQNENQLKLQLNRLRAHTNPTPISSRMTGTSDAVCVRIGVSAFVLVGVRIYLPVRVPLRSWFVPSCVCSVFLADK